MSFLTPQVVTPIPTYRVMNLEGFVEDPKREAPDVTNEEALVWYKNMMTGKQR